MMRVDLTLKFLCIVKSRSIAKSLCEENAVLVNGKPAKSSSPVRAGDLVKIHLRPDRDFLFKLVEVPEKQLSKSVAPTYYEPVRAPHPGEDDN